jgi:hypothetical protein
MSNESERNVKIVVGPRPRLVVDAKTLAAHLIKAAKHDLESAGVTVPLVVFVCGAQMHAAIAIPFFEGKSGLDAKRALPHFARSMVRKMDADGAAVVFDVRTVGRADAGEVISSDNAVVSFAQWRDGSTVALRRRYMRGGQLIVWDPTEDLVDVDSQFRHLMRDPPRAWRCPKGCQPETDKPFFYPPGCLPSREDEPNRSEFKQGVLLWFDGSVSDRFEDGALVPLPDYTKIMEHLDGHDCQPHCVACLEEVVENKV